MNRIARTLVLLAVLYPSLVLTATATAAPVAPLVVSAEQREALGIDVGRASPRALVPRSPLPGRIVLPNDRFHLVTARTEGVLVAPAVAVGDAVVAGQTLARIESPAFVSLQREYLDAVSRYDLARATAEREDELAREGIIAGRRALGSAALRLDAQARVEQQRQALALSGMRAEEIAALERTRRLEASLTLRAPFAGVVLEQLARAGERLDAGGAVYRIGDSTELLVEVHVPLDRARSIAEGTPFELIESLATGRVIAVGHEVHALDQGVLVRGRIERGAEALRLGQFVRVQLGTASDQGMAYAVPASAVVHAEGLAWVFERVEGGFLPVAVEVVGGIGRERVVAGPLTADSELAIRGTAALKAYWLAGGGDPQ